MRLRAWSMYQAPLAAARRLLDAAASHSANPEQSAQPAAKAAPSPPVVHLTKPSASTPQTVPAAARRQALKAAPAVPIKPLAAKQQPALKPTAAPGEPSSKPPRLAAFPASKPAASPIRITSAPHDAAASSSLIQKLKTALTKTTTASAPPPSSRTAILGAHLVASWHQLLTRLPGGPAQLSAAAAAVAKQPAMQLAPAWPPAAVAATVVAALATTAGLSFGAYLFFRNGASEVAVSGPSTTHAVGGRCVTGYSILIVVCPFCWREHD